MRPFFKPLPLIVLLSILYTSCIQRSYNKKDSSIKYSLKINDGWYFKLGDNYNYKKDSYDHSSWSHIDLPHDWGVEGTYDTIHGTDWQSGYLPAGIGWYRKELLLKENPKEHIIELQFDGIYMNSTIYVNGNLVGNQRYGYISFFYDVTPFLRKGKNTIAVKVNHSKPKSARWYTGSGIYRNVWLRVKPKTHFKTLEQYVNTVFISDSLTLIDAYVTILNKNNRNLTGKLVQKVFSENLHLLNSSGQDINIAPNDSIVISGEVELIKPKLWSLEKPNRHLIVNEIYNESNKLIDSDTIYFGIRKIEFSPEWGFKLNSKKTKIKGVCMHHAAGIYGAAMPESILLYKLKMLKNMGCNAIRTAHNPFSPEFYTICDSLGLLVLDEVFDGWEEEKAEDDYGLYFEEDWQKDLTSWVKNNRNHPSVFMYSIGNEVSRSTRETQKALMDFIKNIDDTRPITQGGHDPTRGMKDELLKTQLDIKGFNGDGEEIGRYESYHEEYPMVPIIATEVPHTYQTRGVYRTQTHWRRKDFPAKWEIKGGSAGTMRGLEGKCYPIPNLSENEIFSEEKTEYYTVKDSLYPIINPNFWKENLYFQSSYDNATVRSSARKAWQKVEELDYLMGQFRWTAFDYLGETNQWPSRFANFGVIDVANLPKDHYYLYQSLWSDEPMVHILPHWTHEGKEGTVIPVVVYTNTDDVELFLNNKSLGRQSYKGEQLVWNVPYTPGNLHAKAYKENRLVAEKSFATAKGNHFLSVKANKETLSYRQRENALVFIDIVDKDGNLFPYADDFITISVEGAGILKGVDNGNPIDLTPYSSNSKKAFRGKLVAFVESNNSGKININIKTKGANEVKIQLDCK
ncbi:sugar-binding domain-containing protein [Algibacter mikhailovii]|uniref:sugar-binding domain-containing protein n=1 Tax=Algibacter mikhailovii TaxID=425498 RepID=UPI002494B741|nr:sugar-binding domain-containing protein [Algibacter mikhailovii]